MESTDEDLSTDEGSLRIAEAALILAHSALIGGPPSRNEIVLLPSRAPLSRARARLRLALVEKPVLIVAIGALDMVHVALWSITSEAADIGLSGFLGEEVAEVASAAGVNEDQVRVIVRGSSGSVSLTPAEATRLSQEFQFGLSNLTIAPADASEFEGPTLLFTANRAMGGFISDLRSE